MLDEVIKEEVNAELAKYVDQLPGSDAKLTFVESRTEQRLREEIRSAIRKVTMSPGPHEDIVWEAASRWRPESVLAFADDKDKAVVYLKCFGLAADDRATWTPVDEGVMWPRLQLFIDVSNSRARHEEHAGCTWYSVSCSLGPLGTDEERQQKGFTLVGVEANADGEHHLCWIAPRRLVQLRECLHDAVKEAMGDENYHKQFDPTPFARLGAPMGTTARLSAWLGTLSELVNKRELTPSTVQDIITFFRPPVGKDAPTFRKKDDRS